MKVNASYDEVFKPIKLEIIIENEDELVELYYRLAQHSCHVQKEENENIPEPNFWGNLDVLLRILRDKCGILHKSRTKEVE